MICNAKINLYIEEYESLTIVYSYNENTTFQDLFEYIVYLLQNENICSCYKFSTYYNYKKYEIENLNCKIKNYQAVLDNLYLSKNNSICFCNASNYLMSKEEIINNYLDLKRENSKQKNNINLLEKQNKDNEKKNIQLKKENKDINREISNLKKENTEHMNNLNILKKQKNEEEKKFEQLKKENNDKNKQITDLIKENSKQKYNINILETQKENDERKKKIYI